MRSVKGIVDWIKGYGNDLHCTQLGNLVAFALSVLRGGKLQCAAIATNMEPTTSRKFRIRRAWRWCANTSIDLKQYTRMLLTWLTRSQKVLVIQLDWTELKPNKYLTLMASVVFQGRALPLSWVTVHWDNLKPRNSKKQTRIEDRFVTALAAMIPAGVQVILLADRGFRRVSLLRLLERKGWQYVIRTSRDACIYGEDVEGALAECEIRPGQMQDLGWVDYTYRYRHPLRMVVCRGLTSKEPWYLMTNLSLPPHAITQLYCRRFKIEELFRDQKSHRYGLSLCDAKMKSGAAYDRLWLIGAIALLLACILGRQVEQAGHAKRYQSNTREVRRELSLFRIGWAAYAEGIRWRVRFLKDFQYCGA